VSVDTVPKNLGAQSQTVRACGPVAHWLSRSLRVVESDMDPSGTYHFLLVIHGNPRSISYRPTYSEVKGDFVLNVQFSSYSMCFTPRWGIYRRNFVTPIALKKHSDWRPYQVMIKFECICIRLDTITRRGRRTEMPRQDRAIHASAHWHATEHSTLDLTKQFGKC